MTLTISAIGSLSQRIACISWRLYFNTGPAESEAQAEVAVLGCALLRAGIVGHIQAGNADGAGRPGDLHQAVENDSRRFDDFAVGSLRLCFEADAIDRGIDFGNAEDVGDELAETIMPSEVDRFKTDLLGVGEALPLHVTDQHVAAPRMRADAAAASPTGPAPAT